jgi:hypothetical protein
MALGEGLSALTRALRGGDRTCMYVCIYIYILNIHTYTDTVGQSWPRGTGSVGRGAQGQ